MSIRLIQATFRCDGCEKKIVVDMDPADRMAVALPTLMDMAEDELRGGTTADGQFCSCQDGMHLCEACTLVADEIGPDDYLPTRAEIEAALDRSAGVR